MLWNFCFWKAYGQKIRESTFGGASCSFREPEVERSGIGESQKQTWERSERGIQRVRDRSVSRYTRPTPLVISALIVSFPPVETTAQRQLAHYCRRRISEGGHRFSETIKCTLYKSPTLSPNLVESELRWVLRN